MRTGKVRVLAGALALAFGVPSVTMGTAAARPPEGHTDTQSIVDEFTDNGVPGAMTFADGGHGRWTVDSGTGRVGTQRPIRSWDKVRVFSNTKMFTAAVVLQLVGEGKIRLDATIEEYLPGLVRGHGYAGNKITVRQLLQHTSGMGDYVEDVLNDPHVNDHPWQPEELVRVGLSDPPEFEPGTGWQYSNTGYIVLGMLVERVTGSDIGDEITDRIIRPLGLAQTRYPEPGQRRITGPHAHGYVTSAGSLVADATELEPSIPGSAGSLVSTGPDQTRFVRALLAGQVVRPDLLAQMRSTEQSRGVGYGLGIHEIPLPCGGVAWGHGGNGPGFDVFTAATDDGRSAFSVANGHETGGDSADVRSAVVSALC